ncbi:MAG: MFS transporter, partial [Gammaproteobacteria bacterium]|nr:MFS transporter [Gammaproteobacteria bacterium]
MSTIQYAGLKAILPLFLVVFIDAMGMAIIFPILTPVFMSSDGIMALTTSLHVRNLLYGITMCVFPLAMLFGTPILGDLSDQIGRKKILVICLIGVGMSYMLSGVAIIARSIALLIVSRIVAGIFAGSIATAQAAVVDVSPPEDKAKNISRMLLPATIGFVVGPLLGSFLSNSHLVSWFDLWTPMFFAGTLALLNAIFLWYGFHETHVQKHKLHFKLHRGVEIFIEAFSSRDIRALSVIYLGLQLGWSLYFQFIAIYLLSHYNYNANLIGLFMAMLGVGFAVAMLYAVPFLTKNYKNQKTIFYTLLIATVCYFVTLVPYITWTWIAGFTLALVMAIAYPVLITVYSDLAGADRQGWVMGINNAVIAAAWAITAAIGGLLTSLNNNLTIILGAVFMGIATIGMLRYN